MDFNNSNAISKQWMYWEKVDAKLLNDASRYSTLLEMTQLKYNQTINDINTKIYVEGGTFDDASLLYTEAEAETDAKSKNIFMKFIEAVKNLFGGVMKKIQSLLGMLPDKDVEVKKEDVEHANIITKHFQKIAAAFDKAKNKDFLGAAHDLGLAILPELSVIAGVVILKKSDIINKCDFLNKVCNKAVSILNDILNFIKSHPVAQPLKGAVEALKGFAQKGLNIASGLFASIHKENGAESNGENGGNNGGENGGKKSWGDKKNGARQNPQHTPPKGPNNNPTDNNVKQESYFDDIFGDGDMFTESYDFYF